MPIHGHSTGRRDTGYQCRWVEAMLNRVIQPEFADMWSEAVYRIDAEIPHGAEGYHAMPDAEALADIEDVESALALAGIELHTSVLFRLIEAQTAKHANLHADFHSGRYRAGKA